MLNALDGFRHFLWFHFSAESHPRSLENDFNPLFDDELRLCNQRMEKPRIECSESEEVVLGLCLLLQAREEYNNNPEKFPEFPIPLFE
jgi:hypothetical protein